MNIEEELTNHLSNFDSAPFLFIGSGFSRRYIGLEDWKGLLRKFSSLTGKTYEYYFSKANGNLPQLASLLASDFHEIWWNDSKYTESRAENREKMFTEESPLKVEISEYLKKKTYTYGLSEQNDLEIEQLKSSVIDGIITTNWDLLLENLFPDFKVFIGQSELLFSNNQEILEIYKIHGCVTKPETLVLTTENYNNFNERNSYLAAKLLTIFIEHPIIFLGYGLGDANILEILNSIIKCLTSENISKLKDRLIFVERDTRNEGEALFEGFLSTEGVNLPITRLRTNDFSIMYRALSKYKRKFSAKLIRYLKEQCYQIVLSNDTKDKMHVGVDLEDDINMDDIEFYCGVGISSRLSNIGYGLPTTNDLCEDVIFDKKQFEPVQTVVKTLPYLLSRTKFVPVFKYLKESNLLEGTKKSLDSKILKKKNIDDNYFIRSTIKRQYENKISACQGLDELLEKFEFKKALELIPLLGKNKIDVDKFHELLAENFDLLSDGKTHSSFNKMICYYDWIKYS